VVANERAARWNRLLALLAERGRLSVVEVCDELGVSEATVRRDFTDLASQQLASRTHGGVVATSVAYDLPARYKTSATDLAKQQIAEVAASRVRIGSVVGFNGGTTTSATARMLVTRPEVASSAQRPAVTVVTNSLNISSELVLRPSVRCICLGGAARTESYELTGSLTMSALRDMWLDLLILGVDALCADLGASCRHDDEAAVNAAMVRRAGRVIVVTTGDKVGTRAFAVICPASGIHELITDSRAPEAALAELRELGVAVTVVADPS
jgi:DeoR family transcriptional regulator, aga operon transcriptional repressor